MPPKRYSLLPPPVTYGGTLERTIQSLDQAHGYTAHTRLPVSEVRRPDDHGDWDGLYTSSPSTSGTSTTVISDSAYRSRSPLEEMPPANMSDIVHETPAQAPPLPAINVSDRLDQVSESRRRLVDDLVASTALVNNLRVRCDIHQADLARCKADLASQKIEADEKIKQASKDMMTWLITSCASLGMSVVYVGWCWVNRVEFEYIQRRRREMFGL